MGEIRTGCSGWSYKDWVGPFYPERTAPGQMLSQYLLNFDTVEVNSTFYRIPNEGMVRSWVKRTPDDFLFSAKMYQGVTHEKEMRSVKATYEQYMASMVPLKEKVGSILIQMPQRFKATDSNYALFEDFLSMLHEEVDFTAEFRDRSWFNEKTFSLLESHNVAFCVVSQPQFKGLIPPEPVVTADHAYVRFHGLNYKKWYSGEGSERYNYLYSKEELEDWKPDLEKMKDEATKTVYVYFNNHPSGQAPANAKTMMGMLGISPMVPKVAPGQGADKQRTL
jgi:uncharacterized protein YecE (DUF72 family)